MSSKTFCNVGDNAGGGIFLTVYQSYFREGDSAQGFSSVPLMKIPLLCPRDY